MCTLIVASRIWEQTPLLIAANRDERRDRPARPPALDDSGPIPALAPRDQRAGGTWLGLNARGLFVGITNRFGARPDPDRRSRGLVVHEALAQPDAAAAAAAVAALDASSFNGFHLFLADPGQLFLVWSDGERLQWEEKGPGWHILTERSLDAAETRREPWLLEQLAGFDRAGPPDEQALQQLLASHGEPSFEGLCVHWPELDYGTRSSTLLRLGRRVEDARFLHADGPPCETEYQDYSETARQLLTAIPDS